MQVQIRCVDERTLAHARRGLSASLVILLAGVHHWGMQGALPTGTVTLLFTDIEGSTALVYQLADEYGAMLTAHRDVLRRAVKQAGGFEVDCRADEFFAVFQRAQDAAAAAIAGQRGLAERAWPQGA